MDPAKNNMIIIKTILHKDPKERSSQENKQIQKYFKEIKFFADIIRIRDEKTFLELCERLRIDEF